MDRNLALEFVRITEAAAIASARFMGRGDENAADQAAVDAMRKGFDFLNIDGVVVIGEGERDSAPMLFIGEEVGRKGPDAPLIDIALDPLEGTTICAKGGVGSISVIAVAERGHFLHAPDCYMQKLACGPRAYGRLRLDDPIARTLYTLADSLGKPISDVTVAILDRPRHEELVAQVRVTGARIRLLGDGDVSAGIAPCWEESGIDLLLGTGGAPEGVITAAAMKCLGGDFQGRLIFKDEQERRRAQSMGVQQPDKVFLRDELARGSVMFCATGVTDGPLLKGVRTLALNRARTHSIVMRSATGTVRTIESVHDFNLKSTHGFRV